MKESNYPSIKIFEEDCQDTWGLSGDEVVSIRATSCAEVELRRLIKGEKLSNLQLSKKLKASLRDSGVICSPNKSNHNINVDIELMEAHLRHIVNNPTPRGNDK